MPPSSHLRAFCDRGRSPCRHQGLAPGLAELLLQEDLGGSDAEAGLRGRQRSGSGCLSAAGRSLEQVPPVPPQNRPLPLAGVHRVLNKKCPAASCLVYGEEADTPEHVLIDCPCLAGARLRTLGSIHMSPTQLQDDSVVAALVRGFRRHQEPLADGRPYVDGLRPPVCWERRPGGETTTTTKTT